MPPFNLSLLGPVGTGTVSPECRMAALHGLVGAFYAPGHPEPGDLLALTIALLW